MGPMESPGDHFQTPQAPPGWYPTTPGMQGYWDGSSWTGHTAPLAPAPRSQSDDNTMAMLAHLLAIFTGFIGPLVIFLIKKDESPYVRHHAAESLNFQLTVFVAAIACSVLILFLIGFLLLPVIIIGALILEIVASVAANKGEWYRYPLNIRIVS